MYASLVQKFWATAEERTPEGQPTEIVVTIDGTEYVVTEALVRSQLRLDDEGGEFGNNTKMIAAGLADIGYKADGRAIWKKNRLCPKWRFLVHTLL